MKSKKFIYSLYLDSSRRMPPGCSSVVDKQTNGVGTQTHRCCHLCRKQTAETYQMDTPCRRHTRRRHCWFHSELHTRRWGSRKRWWAWRSLKEMDILTHLPLNKMAAILADDIFKCIFLNGKVRIFIKISLKFVPEGLIDNNQALV